MNLLDFQAGIEHPFFLIAGPCVIESEALAMESASYLKKVCEELISILYISHLLIRRIEPVQRVFVAWG